MKPGVFVGSSSEGLSVAYAIQTNLQNDADVTVWTQDVFRPSEFNLESLLRVLDQADIGVFVFSPDDTVRIRGADQAAVRDNVIFEFGIFVGELGRDHSFIVAPRSENLRLPSDLLGLNVLEYDPNRSDGNLDAALGPASYQIRTLVKEVLPKSSRTPQELALPVFERRDLLSDGQRRLLKAIEARSHRTLGDLHDAFPGMAESELHYRLEQLRLLMLIRHSEEQDPDGRVEIRYFLSDAYTKAKEARK